jgi:bifunctional non-homologous end joining protein LigD
MSTTETSAVDSTRLSGRSCRSRWASRRPGVHWVKPEPVADIAFAEWTANGLLRQPRFEGLRTDKSPRECRRERPRSTREDVAQAETTMSKREPASALAEYGNKRDFRETPEPAGSPSSRPDRESPHAKPIFVVQEHDATRLHYDFRLEAEGVLKSWAVAKEPSLDPAVKRLAVRVEDHPLSYAGFEGTIPRGQYGAGTVRAWDRGTFENADASHTIVEGLDAGQLSFILHGDKLNGRFSLVRMRAGRGKKESWLLIKGRDKRAKPASTTESTARTAPVEKRVIEPKVSAAGDPPEDVTITNPNKVLFPDDGITKADVAAYYRKVAPRLLPFLKDRPITLERLPDGLGAGKPHFWQKNTPDSYPAWIPRVRLETERGEPVRYALVNDLPTLLFLVNQGTLTFHPWLSRIGSLDRPDFVLFDLDPGAAPFTEVVAVARKLHVELNRENREAVVKTSGKKGLHVLVRWDKAGGGYDEARKWALEVALRVAEAMPERATTEIRKAKRGERVYIDVMQNARGHHAVPPYVLRPVPRAPVSTPLRWAELRADLDPKRFSVRTVPTRLARQKHDPADLLLSGK